MDQGPPGMSEQSQGQQNQPPQEGKGNGQAHEQKAQGEMERKGDQPREEQGKSEHVATILKLHLQPIHLDLLGIVLKTDDIHVELDAVSGEGKLLGNLVQQLLPLIDKLHLDSVVGEVTSVLQETVKGLAHEAGGKVKEQGTQIIGAMVGGAADRLKGRLHLPGGDGQHAPAEGH